MKVRYVEAMIQPLSVDLGFGDELDDALGDADEAIAGLFTYADNHDSGDEEESAVTKKLIALAKKANDTFAELADAINDHTCTTPESGLFVPVGSNEDIDTLMRREGFNSADMVAIVKLSDLEMLIADRTWPHWMLTDAAEIMDAAESFDVNDAWPDQAELCEKIAALLRVVFPALRSVA